MLFILTGDIQIGKTRWLMQTLDELETRGVPSYGVIAPGTWIEHSDGSSTTYEKTGINNELLPQHAIIPFARRNDLVDADDLAASCSQAQRAQLAWAIDDTAIQRVNEHFDELASQESGTPGLLVVDEFGRLELLRNEGLTSALKLVERGANSLFPHALIIVREQLLEDAKQRFSNLSWNELRIIRPDDQAKSELFAAFGL